MEPITLEFDRRPSALRYMLAGAYPAPRRGTGMPDIRARWHRHRVDRDELHRFLRITGLRSGDSLPVLYPHVFGFRLPMAVLTHPRFPVPIWGVLQIRNHIVQHRPIALDAALEFETRLAAQRYVEKGAEYDLHTTVRVGGGVVWESLVTFYARSVRGNAGPPPPLTRAPAAPSTKVTEWTMSDDDHWTFGSFTGDYNGIHAWDWYARKFGFPRALYHPPRVLAQCLARLPKIHSDAAVRLDAWLKGPVHHGASVRLHAETADGETRLALFAGSESRPSIVALLA
jgi:acyl dehydratase